MKLVLIIVMILLFFTSPLLAQSPPFFGYVSELTIEWAAPTENEDGSPLDGLIGYYVYYGRSSHSAVTEPTVGGGDPSPYDFIINVQDSSALSYLVTGLGPGDWFFRLTAYDHASNESGFSPVEASASLGISPVQSLACVIGSGGGETGVGTITNISPSNYDPHNLTLDDLIYIDRSYRTTEVPAPLFGLDAIRTANGDKHNASEVFVSFDIDNDGILYIGYDSRSTVVPSWLSANYINTGLVIDTDDIPFNVWSRSVSAGTVEIPGNKYGNPIGSDGNYLILIRFD